MFYFRLEVLECSNRQWRDKIEQVENISKDGETISRQTHKERLEEKHKKTNKIEIEMEISVLFLQRDRITDNKRE